MTFQTVFDQTLFVQFCQSYMFLFIFLQILHFFCRFPNPTLFLSFFFSKSWIRHFFCRVVLKTKSVDSTLFLSIKKGLFWTRFLPKISRFPTVNRDFRAPKPQNVLACGAIPPSICQHNGSVRVFVDFQRENGPPEAKIWSKSGSKPQRSQIFS